MSLGWVQISLGLWQMHQIELIQLILKIKYGTPKPRAYDSGSGADASVDEVDSVDSS